MPKQINIKVRQRTVPSAIESKVNGAHGPTLSNKIPPNSTKTVVPREPKKWANPLSVPLMCGFIFLINSTSTLMNYTRDTTMSRTVIV